MFPSCRILCWFTVWQGIALLSPDFERNTFLTSPCERPFITDSSLGSIQGFKPDTIPISIIRVLGEKVNSVLRTPGFVPRVSVNLQFHCAKCGCFIHFLFPFGFTF